MDFLFQFLVRFRILLSVFITISLVQTFKVISRTIKTKKLNLRDIFSTGGMPSSHSSAVMALVTAVAFEEPEGIYSKIFAICLVFGLIVMYDSAGIRRAAGRHAAILNNLLNDSKEKSANKINDFKLRELLGHTPLEVTVGAIVGVIVSYIVLNVFN